MSSRKEISKHESIQSEIVAACRDLGAEATQEHQGKGWRADVLAIKNLKKIAFEIQISPQTLKKTLDRQAKYIGEGITGCWLVEKPLPKYSTERPDLPLFYVASESDGYFSVSLSGRRKLPMYEFLKCFLAGEIRFSSVAQTKRQQRVKLVFYEMECWKCHAMNHIYYVDSDFSSACNATIQPEESLWGSDRGEYRPEIIRLAREFAASPEGQHLRLGEIKPRFSRTVQASYVSFGCYKCDSIFGDYFVMDAEMEAVYGVGQVGTMERDINLDVGMVLPIPHWCFPSGQPFCDQSLDPFEVRRRAGIVFTA